MSGEQADSFAAELRGFGPVGLVAMAVVVASALLGGWVAAAFVLLWAYLSGTPWGAIGLSRPRKGAITAVFGFLFGGVFKVFSKSVLLPLMGVGPVNQAYHFLVGNTDALPGIVFLILVSGAFGEEVFYRGYLFERLGKLLGKSVPARIVTVLVAAILFGLAHFVEQGWSGVLQAVITGLVFGTIYAFTGRLWFLMFAHAGFDLTAVAIIYENLETKVAHLFFH